jgi:hypothetical protein
MHIIKKVATLHYLYKETANSVAMHTTVASLASAPIASIT